MLRLPRRFVSLMVVLVAATGVMAARQTPATPNVAGAALTDIIPVDSRITVRTLPNGLRYYIRVNREPRNRAELRLVVNAGSVLEDQDQRGLAHMVEHMAFNGTTHFPKSDVVSFMQTIGMRFGAHVNAHTGFDETVYQLQIPTDNPAVVDRSLLALEDWAHNVSFDPVEVDKERGVVLEEWRLGLGADERIQAKQFPVLLGGSRYAERQPIGKPEIIQSFPYDRLKQFYTDWYRPDLMAVIAVGDFDPAVMERLITSHFSPIPVAQTPRPRPRYDVPEQPGTRYAIATDPEETRTTIGVVTTMAARDQRTVGSYRQSMVERLFASMLSIRLQEVVQKPDAPFLAAGTERSLLVRSAEVTALNAAVNETGIERGLAALFAEADRVTRFGFTATELDRQKATLLRLLERLAGDRDVADSAPLADEYIRNFAQQEPIPGIAYEYAMHQRFLPQITLAEINALAKEWVPDRNRVVMVSAPQKPGLVPPDEAKLAAVLKATSGTTLTAYVDTVSAKPLIEPLPRPGSVVTSSTQNALGITDWVLSNHVHVVLKPTTFKPDEILFSAISPGGTSLAADRDYVAAETADTVIAEGGLGPFSQAELDKKLAGKTVFVRPEIGDMFEGLSGGASNRDLETLFQLIHLTFTQPRADAEAFRALTAQLSASLANREALPDVAFNDTLHAALTSDNPRARPLSLGMLSQMSLDRSLAFYKDRFADASDFTFVFVGSFDPAVMKPLVERYLGSLPALNRKEAGKDLGIRPPTGIVEKEVVKGLDPKSEVSVVFTGPFRNDPMNRLVLKATAEMLQGNLHQALREELGGTYGVSVTPGQSELPVPSYQLTIDFTCDPARTDALVARMFQEVAQFRSRGPGEGQIADARLALARDLEVNSRDNRYLLRQMTYKYQFGEDVAEVFNLQRDYDKLSASAIRDAARTYLDPARYVKVILRPAKQ
ncbi:MAG: insulinase family protein [Vicinamibacterales bacterium]